MLFNSDVFIFLFLPTTLCGFYALRQYASIRAAKLWLVAASIIFYGWWSPSYIVLLLASIGANFFISHQIARTISHPRKWLTVGVVFNLLLSDLEWFVMPAILLEQFRVYYAPVPGKAGELGAQQPAAVAIWAMVSDEVEARLKEAGANARLKLSDWRSGKTPYLVDIIAPFGQREKIEADWRDVIGG